MAFGDQTTLRAQQRVRETMAKPYKQMAFPCDNGWASGADNYVVDVTRWAAAAGLTRGDRLLAFGGVSFERAESAEVWAHVPPGEYVDIRVERAGNQVSIRLPCRDNSQAWQEEIAAERALLDGRWQTCIDAIRRYTSIKGLAPASTLLFAALCAREKAVLDPLGRDEYWRLLHAWATKVISESRYRPTGLTDARASLLSAIEALEGAGHKARADDIKAQIAAFDQGLPQMSPRADSKAIEQRGGTAFAVRPDGFLITAFHVVKDADEIEVSCPEIGKVKALVEKFSESNDLALLRVAEGHTPNYLRIAEPKSLRVGQRVFTIGYPAPQLLGREAKFAEGAISSLSSGGDVGLMQISVPVQPGNSGGPLVDDSGQVVGIVIETASVLSFLKQSGTLPQNVSWAVKGAFALALFDLPSPAIHTTDRNTLIGEALKATCSVTASAEVAAERAE